MGVCLFLAAHADKTGNKPIFLEAIQPCGGYDGQLEVMGRDWVGFA